MKRTVCPKCHHLLERDQEHRCPTAAELAAVTALIAAAAVEDPGEAEEHLYLDARKAR
jgi:RNA polymerase subunit RPABC4/transcription elongation factor Spt4